MCGDHEFASLNLEMYLGLKQCPLAVMAQFPVQLKLKKKKKTRFKQLILVLMLLSVKI